VDDDRDGTDGPEGTEEGVRQLRLVVTAPAYDEALTFYRDVLGLAEEASFSSSDGRVSILSAGRATLEITDPANAEFIDEVEVGRRVAGHLRVAFEVADATEVTDRLARAGATVIAPPTRTPWQSNNARLDAPGDLHVTVFADASQEAAPRTVDEIMVGRVGTLERLDAPVVLAEADPSWPVVAAALVADIRRILGPVAMLVEHAGSTSIPGLAAKPVIDLVLGVPDPADEDAYVGRLEGLGYTLRVREPEWHEHRLLRHSDPTVNLHVFGIGSTEIDRMLAFRDHLRNDADDRAFYLRTKRGLARRRWELMQQYADAKGEVVEQIITRALRCEPRPLTGVVVLSTGEHAAAGQLAHDLGVPLLSTDRAPAELLLDVVADCPAAVLHGALPREGVASLAHRVIADDSLPDDSEARARAVRQLARYPSV
jgi:GrpB-like predicted nucleotidyltransferase (UPF0157 family)/predicted enzyme related to lactoylglutathione lyase